MTIGQRIRSERKKKKLTQQELAEIMGINNTAVSKWEADVNQPDYVYLIKMCDLFECTADYLLGRTDTIAAHRTNDPMSDLSQEGLEFFKKVIEPIVEKEIERRLKGRK
jgi:transcriptional regulator with XRE-family HTH domain